MTARALPALLELVAAHPGQQILAASHEATIRLLVGSLLGFDLRRYRDHLDQSPASLSIVNFQDAGHARLSLFNDISRVAPSPSETPGMATGRLSAIRSRSTS